MKRLFLFIALCFSMLTVACDKQGGDDIKVAITSESVVDLGMYGEDVTIHYDILGIEDVEADVTISDETWLRVKEHESGSLVLTVADNETGSSRMAAVRLSYGGSSATAIINQSGDALAPEITIMEARTNKAHASDMTIEIVAKDKNGNWGKLFLEEMYLYRSDDKSASEYTYKENK